LKLNIQLFGRKKAVLEKEKWLLENKICFIVLIGGSLSEMSWLIRILH